jgi:hypothetical protein
VIRIGIIGPARRRSGTGPFVARALRQEGATVAAVCATTPLGATEAAAALAPALGEEPAAFADVESMLAGGALDAVAICSPAATHERHLAAALCAGVHVLCEKPLTWRGDGAEAGRVATVADAFARRALVLQENAQWPFVLPVLRELTGHPLDGSVRRFEMHLAPPSPGAGMFAESVSHPASLLVALGARGRASGVEVQVASPDSIALEFMAGREQGDDVSCLIALHAMASQPRPCTLVFDRLRIDRMVLRMDPYELGLRYDDRTVPIEDPLRASVRRFLQRVRTGEVEPDVGLAARARLVDALWPAVRDACAVAGCRV